MKTTLDISIEVKRSLFDIDEAAFRSIESPDFPFFHYDFLYALEKSGSIGPDTGWEPCYHLAKSDEKLIGAVIAYDKYDSYGEYIFDWEWARAYQSGGIEYYPKGTVAAPFTPANGPRFLIHPDYTDSKAEIIKTLVTAQIEYGRNQRLSSWHLLFLEPDEMEILGSNFDFMERRTHQYHWLNNGYEAFDDYLADLRSKKRKDIKRERRYLAEEGIEIHRITGDGITQQHIDYIWRFYRSTTSQKWGRPYLNEKFFQIIGERFKDRTVLVLAAPQVRPDYYIGGTINFFAGDNVFGRYWGCTEHVKHLHFECCYYQLIEFAIETGKKKFEAGAQGEHKFNRGFDAKTTLSAHFFYNPSGQKAIQEFLEYERKHNGELIEHYERKSALKKQPESG